MKKDKKDIVISGRLLRPLVIGQSALLFAGGMITHTSRVISIHEQTEDIIHFETAQANYHLSLCPFPFSAVNPIPVRMTVAA